MYPFKMGTIRPHKGKGKGKRNTTAYGAQIRINRNGQRVYQETQTFGRKQAIQVFGH
ncbi:hypothetical protein ACTACJ_11125 [Pseudomonas syringae]|uniref:hypothetical protein n=1 Tax=Pseudomonas syringae TaxID=317 RepID=UPI003F86F941